MLLKTIGAAFGVNHLSVDFRDERKHFIWVQAVKYMYFIIFHGTEK